MELSREWIGARATFALTLLVAVLSIATGLVNITSPPTNFGPFARLVPPVVQTTAGFTGTLTGFLMFGSAFGLRRRLRAAWQSTLVLLPITAVQGLVQSNELSLPLVAVSLLALPVTALNRRRFDREVDLTTTQWAAVTALVGAQGYATVGSFALRDQFANLDSLIDAFYFALVTGSTVGYGDIHPTTEIARLFGLSVLLVTVSSFAVALGVLLTPAIEARLTKALGRMTETQLELLENHVLVLGYGDLTEPILQELKDAVDFVVITPAGDQATSLVDHGYDVFTGDPSDEETLRRANVEEARAVVAATNNDAEDALAILTARSLNPDVRIVAAATHRENVNKLRRAGADTVISPATIGGRLLVRSALGGEHAEAIADELETGEAGEDGDDEGGDDEDRAVGR